MANFYKVNGPLTGFIASEMKKIGYKNISYVEIKYGENSECLIHMKDGSHYELLIMK